ncbi:hypothetical protein MUA03_17215 [Enterobacteriaceae bacterium H16N7]|nr:hypothetical protein [Dryocola clanedunensis]
MTALVFVLLAVLLPWLSLDASRWFIRRHDGRQLKRGLCWLLYSGFTLCILALIPDVLSARYLPASRLLMLYVFSLSFVITDLSNRWLPLEFTAPFCLCALVLCPGDKLNAMQDMAAVWLLLAALRQGFTRLYGREALGMGDVWMMSGFAGLFSLTTAFALMLAGLLLMALSARHLRAQALPLAPFVVFFSTLYGLCQPFLTGTWRMSI